MEDLLQKIESLLSKMKGREPRVTGYSTIDKRLFCIPEHYPGTGQFNSDIINDIYYANLLAKLCGGDVEEVYIIRITKSHRYKNKKLYFINTENSDAADIVIDSHIWDWVE